ncbi:MAG: GYD domain-containing protein [Caldilinea sp. CFX5]|nr:GYD domain-containing protein [Caldilinea sp. CFX5]
MAYYLLQASYTAEGWAAQIKNPQDVRQRVQAAFEKIGGKIGGVWYAFGEADIVAILEYPSNVNAAAYAVAVMASGVVKELKTTPLLTIEEGIAVMQQAAAVSAVYQPPGQ